MDCTFCNYSVMCTDPFFARWSSSPQPLVSQVPLAHSQSRKQLQHRYLVVVSMTNWQTEPAPGQPRVPLRRSTRSAGRRDHLSSSARHNTQARTFTSSAVQLPCRHPDVM